MKPLPAEEKNGARSSNSDTDIPDDQYHQQPRIIKHTIATATPTKRMSTLVTTHQLAENRYRLFHCGTYNPIVNRQQD